jgi:hypothetical protein
VPDTTSSVQCLAEDARTVISETAYPWVFMMVAGNSGTQGYFQINNNPDSPSTR